MKYNNKKYTLSPVEDWYMCLGCGPENQELYGEWSEYSDVNINGHPITGTVSLYETNITIYCGICDLQTTRFDSKERMLIEWDRIISQNKPELEEVRT